MLHHHMATRITKKTSSTTKDPPKRRRSNKQRLVVHVDQVTPLTNFKIRVSTERLPMRAQVGGNFVFTYQRNGKTEIYDERIQAFSKRSKVPATQLTRDGIARLLVQAERFAMVQFLQKTGLETVDVTLIEFQRPILYKYYESL